MIPKKPAPGLIGGGNRFSDQIMRNEKKLEDPAERDGNVE
jgi:hypothetical protein